MEPTERRRAGHLAEQQGPFLEINLSGVNRPISEASRSMVSRFAEALGLVRVRLLSQFLNANSKKQ